MLVPMLKAWWHRKKVKAYQRLCIKYVGLLLQANLGGLNGKQVEEDYKLVENEGLFQEYLEMGSLDWTGH